MGFGPMTKADYDRRIAQSIAHMEHLKSSLANVRGNDSSSKAYKGQLRYQIAREKGIIAQLKAERKNAK